MRTDDATMRVQLILDPELFDDGAFGRFWLRLADPIARTETYDIRRPTERLYTPQPSAPLALFRDRLSLLTSGDGGRVTGVLEWRKLITFDAWVRMARWDERLRAWALSLFCELPVLYGFACSTDEYDAHHLRSRLTGRGGEVSGDKGTTAEFPAFLPGIYWLNFIGAALAAGLPLARLESLAGVGFEVWPRGKAVLSLDGPPFVEDLGPRLALSRQVAAALGDDYFYDRDRPERQLRTVPTLEPLRERLQVRS